MSRAEIWKICIASVTCIATIAIIVYGVVQYRDSLHQEKINKVYRYFNRFTSGEVLKARLSVELLSDELFEKFQKEAKGKTQKVKPYEKLLIEEYSKKENYFNYNNVTEFFDSIYECSKAGGCDKNTAKILFSREACQFLFRTYLFCDYTNKRDIKIHGAGLKCLATKYKSGCEKESCKKSFIAAEQFPRHCFPKEP